jgi:rod shape-determining protein MreC
MPPASLWARYRDEILLGAFLLAFLLLISAQVTTPEGSSLLKRTGFRAVAPVIRLGHAAYEGVLRVWSDYAAFRRVAEDNEVLREEVTRLRLEKLRWNALRLENDSLRQLMDFRPCLEWKSLAVRVSGRDLQEPWRMLIVDRGSDAGLHRDMAVVSLDGVVGRVLITAPRSSQIQLLTDAQSAVSAVHLPSGEQVLLKGRNRPLLQAEHLSEKVRIAEGDALATAGLEGIYPEGFLVGYVESVHMEGGRQRAWVRPAAGLKQVRNLFVLTEPRSLPETEPEATGTSKPAAP